MIRKTNQFVFSWSESRPYKATNGSKFGFSVLARTSLPQQKTWPLPMLHTFCIRIRIIQAVFLFMISSSEMPWSCAKMGLKKCGCFKIHGMYMGERGNDSKQWLNANEIPSLLPSKIHTWKTDEQNKTKPWYMAQHRLWLCLNQHNGTQCRSTSLYNTSCIMCKY